MEKYNKQKLSHLQAFKSTELDKNPHDSKTETASQILDEYNTQQNEFNLDRQEYQQVFKVFDKDNSGEINIQQVYELINKFETDQNLNLNPSEGTKARAAVSNKTYGIGNNSLYSNGTKKTTNESVQATRQRDHKGQVNGIENNGGMKFSPQRKLINGGVNAQNNQAINAGTATAGSNILQLRPTQLTTLNNNPNFKENNINNRSPRRHSHLYQPQKTSETNGVKNDASRPMSIKLNGIGPSGISQIGSSKSDGKSNTEELNEDNSPGLLSPGINPKIKKTATATQALSGSANNLLGSSNPQHQITSSSTPTVMEFPNGKETIKFDEFINIIEDSCNESQLAENYLILAFSMFDRQKKGYISSQDLKEVFEILGEQITEDEVNTMIKIAGIKSNDKINFKEFVDFFYKID